MKLSISRSVDGDRGLQKFTSSLLKELSNSYKVQLVDKSARSDIHLIIINGDIKKGSKNIVRLDGVYYDTKRLHCNAPILKTLKKVDGVIYQSFWAKRFVEGMLKYNHPECAVIYNGVDQSLFQGLEVEKNNFKKIFVCCSNWKGRPNKRLKSIIKAFLKTVDTDPQGQGLYVIGKTDLKISSPYIVYFGHCESLKVRSLLISSDYMVHICHLDACPNSVVEGLSAGLPVLTNNIGGTPEITAKSGIILELDSPFCFKPVKDMNAVGNKSIDQNILYQGMIDMMKQKWEVNRPDLDIKVSAKKYFDFFNKLLEQ